MSRNFRVSETNNSKGEIPSSYYEIAVHVRNLLECDYAMIAVPEGDAIRIKGMAGRESIDDSPGEILSKLAGWGPAVVDDARLIAVPVNRSGHPAALLVGYSSRQGRFTAEDLERLMAYSPVVLELLNSQEILKSAAAVSDVDELLHLSRLVTLGELSASFAHEVKNPLTTIKGHVMFMDEALPPDHSLRGDFEAIDRAAKRIEELAARMLDYSRKKTRSRVACDINEVIAEALRFLQLRLKTESIRVEVQVDDPLTLIEADRCQLIQAIINLIQNAADSMQSVNPRVLSITVSAGNRNLRIAVSDTGKGIEPQNIQRIFDPFFTTKAECGTGLGLYITRRIIEEHKGSITVEPTPCGTTFAISLPLG